MAGYGREAFFMDCRQRKMTCVAHTGLMLRYDQLRQGFEWLVTSEEEIVTAVQISGMQNWTFGAHSLFGGIMSRQDWGESRRNGVYWIMGVRRQVGASY